MRLLMAFQAHFPDQSPAYILQAPGRDLWVAATFNDQPSFTVATVELDAHTTFSYRSAKTRTTVFNRPLPGWARYPAGVLLALRDLGMEKTGLLAALGGSEPAGPRYEHALGITLAALWHEIFQQPYTTQSLVELVEQVRREYVEA